VTSDDVVVVAHDRRLNPEIARALNGTYVADPGPTIRSLALPELRRYDVGVLRPGSRYAAQFPQQKPVPGTPIPTLAEIVALVERSGNARVRFNIETKLSPLAPEETLDPAAFAAAVVDAIRALGIAERTTIQSFDWRSLREVQRLAPELPTACLTIERGRGDNIRHGAPGPSPWTAGLDIDAEGGSVPALVARAGCRIWSPFFRDLDAARLEEARRLGLAVVVWTVNEAADIAAMLDLGVDGIIGDYPDRLRAAAAERGLALPEATPVAP
jgi:glycerophosphoryl diester phosphodiesterase